jgi:hypothetical protein
VVSTDPEYEEDEGGEGGEGGSNGGRMSGTYRLTVTVSVLPTLEVGWYCTDSDHKLYKDSPLPTEIPKGADGRRDLVVQVGGERADCTPLVHAIGRMHSRG